MTKIEYTLREANRYDGVIDIINNIIITTAKMTVCPVNPYNRNGMISYRVSGKDVSEEAVKFLRLINGEDEGFYESDFMNLRLYVKTKSDIQLHNFAVLCSHRVSRPNSEVNNDLNTIRNWEILDNMLAIFNSSGHLDKYTIPNGWRMFETDLWDINQF